MSSPRQPVTLAQYRRRRTYALLALILVIWLISSGVNSLIATFAGGATPAPSHSQAAPNQPCGPGAIKVQAIVGDGTSPQLNFASGDNPKIWFTVNNVGSVSCTFNVGSSVQFFKITSGSETIWDSKQCDRSADKDAVVTIKAGQTLTSPAGEWFRVYSSDSGCGAEQNQVTAGGSSYHLAVTVNGVISTDDPQFVLN